MLLALESSDRLCAACVFDMSTGTVIASKTIDIGRAHAEFLIGVIDGVLAHAQCSYKSLTGVAVCVGPGSFTGIRVGVSAAIGFGIALDVPTFGVTSLQALATAHRNSEQDVLCLIDANRGDVYVQTFFSQGFALDDPRQMSLADIAALPSLKTNRVAGSGAALIAAAYPNLELNIADHSNIPSVENIAIAALHPKMCVAAKPLYLRRPDAKPQEAYTLARALR